MVTGINESATFESSNQTWNNNKCRCKCTNRAKHRRCEKDYVSNPVTCSCENGKNGGSVIDDSTFTFNEIMEEKKLLQQKVLHEKPF